MMCLQIQSGLEKKHHQDARFLDKTTSQEGNSRNQQQLAKRSPPAWLWLAALYSAPLIALVTPPYSPQGNTVALVEQTDADCTGRREHRVMERENVLTGIAVGLIWEALSSSRCLEAYTFRSVLLTQPSIMSHCTSPLHSVSKVMKLSFGVCFDDMHRIAINPFRCNVLTWEIKIFDYWFKWEWLKLIMSKWVLVIESNGVLRVPERIMREKGV